MKYYTSGRLAKLLGMSAKKVCSLIDSGKIKGVRLPAENGYPGDRRVSHRDAVEFAQGMGIADLTEDGIGLCLRPEVAKLIAAAVPIILAQSVFECGLLLGRATHPWVLIDGQSVGLSTVAEIVAALPKTCRVELIAADDWPQERLELIECGVHWWPFHAPRIIEALKSQGG